MSKTETGKKSYKFALKQHVFKPFWDDFKPFFTKLYRPSNFLYAYIRLQYGIPNENVFKSKEMSKLIGTGPCSD